MKKLKGILSAAISMLLVLAIVLTPISNVQAAGQNKKNQQAFKYAGDGYEVTFQVTSQWDGAFNADVKLKNTSDKTIDNWALQFAMPHEITNIWNGKISSHDDGSYVIKNVGSNQDVEPGREISFGFSANWANEVQIPDTFQVLSFKKQVPSEKYEVSFLVTSDWGSAFNGEIKIKNISEDVIEDWQLEFNFDYNIERFWTAKILEHTGNYYHIKNAGYNSNIKPNETITLGFSGNPGKVSVKPTDYVLSNIVSERITIVDMICEKNYIYSGDTVKINAIVKAAPNEILNYYWNSTGGLIKGENDNITWTAPDELGPYTLTLRVENSEGESNTKSVDINVVPRTGSPDPYEIIDPLIDTDKDGLLNQKEIEIGTSPWSSDTDDDFISDLKELEIGTNPCNMDTDGDTVYDGAELELGTNPLVADIKEGTKFIVRKEIGEDSLASVEMTGEGNAFYNTFSLSDNPLFYSFNYMAGVPVVLTSPELIDRAVIKIKYDENELLKKGIQENELKIFKYDSLKKMFVQITNSTVDVSNNSVICEDDSVLEYKSYYIAATTGLQTESSCEFDIVFALDMTKDLQNSDAGFSCREGLKNLTEYIPDGSSVSIIRSSPVIELLESASTDKEVIQYCFEDLVYKAMPGSSDLCSLIDKGIEVLSQGTNSKGKVLYILSASYNSVDQGMLLERLKSARNEGIVIYITGLLGNTDLSPDIRAFLQYGYGRINSTTAPETYDISVGEIRNDFRVFSTLKADYTVKSRYMNSPSSLYSGMSTLAVSTPPEKIDVHGFDLQTHSFSIKNEGGTPYGNDDGFCAGFTMASCMNFFGMLPCYVAITDLDRNDDNESDDFNFISNDDIAYNLYIHNNFLDMKNRDISKLGNNDEVRKMLSYWWLRATHRLDKYNDLFRSEDTSISGLSEGYNYLETDDLDFITNEIQNGYPVYIDIGNSYEFTPLLKDVSYHSVMAYGYSKEYVDNIPVKVDLKVYDPNYPMDSTKVISIIRKQYGRNYVNQWSYSYNMNPRYDDISVYTSDGAFRGAKVTNRRFKVFDMQMYKSLFDSCYNSSKTVKASIKEESKYDIYSSLHEDLQTTINLAVPIETDDKWQLYTHNDRTFEILTKETIPKQKTIEDNFVNYTMTLNNIFNQSAIGIKSMFEEKTVSLDGKNQIVVNMQDSHPDTILFPANCFNDISSYLWCAREIKIAKLMGVVNGYPDGYFRPGNNVTRAEFVAMAIKASQSMSLWADDFYIAKNEADKYSDLKDHWARQYCGFASANGWMEAGDEGNSQFIPDTPVTREEAAYILWNIISSSKANRIKALVKNNSSTVPYNDMNNINAEYKSAVSMVNLNNIMTGHSNGMYTNFNPKNNLTRGESCKMIINCLQ